MQSRISILVVACLAFLTASAFAQQAATTTDTNEPNAPSFPYIAEINGNNVYIRSNAGTQYYPCGKLNKGDRVNVVSRLFTWSRIVPPAGSFSWISMQYVTIDPNNAAVGTVTGDGVRVYAGAEDRAPIHSTTIQLKLDKGDKVSLLGQEQDDYYKIAPPDGVYLWVSTQYTEALGAVGEVMTPDEPNEPTPSVVPSEIPEDAKKLDAYYALQDKLEAERAKPLDQQNYADIKEALLELAADEQAGKAARYAKYGIKQIERYELALEVDKAVKLQDTQLQQTLAKISKAHNTKLDAVGDLGRFAVIGRLLISDAYGPEAGRDYYRIIDASANTICYALPTGNASGMNLTDFVGRKVGLIGSIEPHQPTSGALVRFSDITNLQ